MWSVRKVILTTSSHSKLFDGEVFSGDDFNRIAAIPTREESLSKLILLFMSPLTQFMNVVKSPMVNLVNVLNNLKQNKS